MPIKTQGDLPVKEILERENIFVMDEKRAMHQDIRPIHILILNLMPLKEETELQLLRSLSNTPLQVDVTFMAVESHEAKNTSLSHLNKFYETFTDIKKRKFDGMIITGAPVEQMPFEEVDYWNELTEIMDWTEKHVTSTIFLCWAAQASLYHFYGLEKKPLDKKMFGLFQHRVLNRKIPLVRGFDEVISFCFSINFILCSSSNSFLAFTVPGPFSIISMYSISFSISTPALLMHFMNSILWHVLSS